MKAISKGSGDPAYYLRIPMYWHETAAFPRETSGEEYTLVTPVGTLKFERPYPGIVRIQAGPYKSEQEARDAYDVLLSYFIIAQVGHELFTYVRWPLQELQDVSESHRFPPGINPWAHMWPTAPVSLKASFSHLAHIIPDHEHVIEQEVFSGGRILQDLPTIIKKLDDAAKQFLVKPPERARELAFFFSEARAATKLAGTGSLVQIMRFQNDISLLEALAPSVPVSERTRQLVDKLIEQISTEDSGSGEDDSVDRKYLKDTLERAKERSIGRGLRILIRNLFAFHSLGSEFLEYFKSRTRASDLMTDAYDLRSRWTHQMQIPQESVADGSWLTATQTAKIAAMEALRQYVLSNEVSAT